MDYRKVLNLITKDGNPMYHNSNFIINLFYTKFLMNNYEMVQDDKEVRFKNGDDVIYKVTMEYFSENKHLFDLLNDVDIKGITRYYINDIQDKLVKYHVNNGNNTLFYSKSMSFKYYFENVTYCFFTSGAVKIYKRADLILGIEREYYVGLNDIELEKFDNYVVYEMMRCFHLQFIELLCQKNLDRNMKLFVKTHYNQVSRYRSRDIMYMYLRIVLINPDNYETYLVYNSIKNGSLYNRNECIDDIFIMMLYDDLISNPKEIYRLIWNDKEIDDILTTPSKLKIEYNNMRIGFNMYVNGLRENTKELADIVDDSININNDLMTLNSAINREINNIFK